MADPSEFDHTYFAEAQAIFVVIACMITRLQTLGAGIICSSSAAFRRSWQGPNMGNAAHEDVAGGMDISILSL